MNEVVKVLSWIMLGGSAWVLLVVATAAVFAVGYWGGKAGPRDE